MKTLLFALAVSMITPAFSATEGCELDTPIKLSELDQGAFTKVTVAPHIEEDQDEDAAFYSSDKVRLEFATGPEMIDDVDVLGARLSIEGTDLALGPDSVNRAEFIRRLIYKDQSAERENTISHSFFESTTNGPGALLKAFSDIVVVGDEIRSIEIAQLRTIEIGANKYEVLRFFCVTHASR